MGILGTMAAADDTQEQPVVRAEDTPSLEALYAAHAASLTRVLHAAGFPDPADAVQAAFVQGVVHWRKVSRYDDPVAWIRRVAINRGLNRRRSRQRRDALTARITATPAGSAWRTTATRSRRARRSARTTRSSRSSRRRRRRRRLRRRRARRRG